MSNIFSEKIMDPEKFKVHSFLSSNLLNKIGSKNGDQYPGNNDYVLFKKEEFLS